MREESLVFVSVHKHWLKAHAAQVAWASVDAFDGVVRVVPQIRTCGLDQMPVYVGQLV